MKQIRPNGVMEDSPLSSPVTSPNHQTESGVSFERENDVESMRHGVKRSLDGVEGEGVREREREREKERRRERGRETKRRREREREISRGF